MLGAVIVSNYSVCTHACIATSIAIATFCAKNHHDMQITELLLLVELFSYYWQPHWFTNMVSMSHTVYFIVCSIWFMSVTAIRVHHQHKTRNWTHARASTNKCLSDICKLPISFSSLQLGKKFVAAKKYSYAES